MIRHILAALFVVLLLPAIALAQGTVQQVGPVTSTHSAVWVANGQIGDSNNFPGWLSGQLDTSFSSSPGAMLCRGPNGWQAITPPTNNGQFLASTAPATCPSWVTASPGGVVQSGNVIGGDCTQWVSGNVVSDAGAPCGNGALTRAQIPSVTIGSAATITLAGYATAGDLGAGATYSSVGATSTGWGAIQDAGGNWFNLVAVGRRSNAGWFGARGDTGATLLSSGDLAANPQWRGCYTTSDSWDTVGIYESFLYAHATKSTPCVTSTPHFSWNSATATQNLQWLIPSAPTTSGSYGITQQIFGGGFGFDWEFGPNRGSCLTWLGASNVALLKTAPLSYANIKNICLQNNVRATTAATGAPIWIIDLDGSGVTGSPATQQVLVQNGFIAPRGLNENGVSINPVGGNSAQGSTIVFMNTEFVCNPGAQYAIRNNGANALANMLYSGDIQACPQVAVKNIGGGNFDILGTTMENQNLSGFFFSPVVNQMLTNGADFWSTGGVTSATSRINIDRSESDVGIICANSCIANLGAEIGQADQGAWTANIFNQLGTVVTSSVTAPGHWFMLAATGGLTNGLTSQGWRNSNAATSTACHIDDSGPGSPGYTPNQWVGYVTFWRFSNGFQANTGFVRWNSASTVSWCTNTNSQIASPGSTLTVNSVTNGGNTVAIGDTLVGPGIPIRYIVNGTISGTTRTVTSIVSEFGALAPGGLITGTGITAGTQIVSQLSGTPGGVGTYSVNNSQTVSASTRIVQAYVTILSQASGTAGGPGTYTLSQTMPTLASQAIEIGPVSGDTIAPPADEEYTIIGVGGSTIPAGFATLQGQHVVGETDGGNSGFGITTTKGSTSVTIVGMTPVNNDWIMIPNGSTVGDPVDYSFSAAIVTGFFAQLSACSGSPVVCTMSYPAEVSLTHVSAYESAGVADGQLTWIDLDSNTIQGVRELQNARFNIGRGENIARYSNVTVTRPDWYRGSTATIPVGGFTPNYNYASGITERGLGNCSITATTPWPVGTTNDLRCSISVDTTLSPPPSNTGRAGYISLNSISTGTAHTITFGTGFVIPSNFSPTFTTSGVINTEKSFLFAEDGVNGWVEVAGPNQIGPGPGLWPSLTLTGTSQVYSQSNGMFMRVRRSNSGTAMTDTLPASTALVNGAQLNIVNSDASASDTVSAGAGSTISAGIAGAASIIVQPGRDLWLAYDAANTTWRSMANSSMVFVPPARVSGNWYMGPGQILSAGLTTASVTTTYFAPLIVYRPVVVTNLGIWLNAGQAASSIQLAVYADNGSGSPLLGGGPLMSTSNITATASTTNVNGSVTPATLQPGVYWAAVMSNNTGIVVAAQASSGNSSFQVYAGATSQANLSAAANTLATSYTLTGQTFGTFPTSGSPATAQAGGPALQYESQ